MMDMERRHGSAAIRQSSAPSSYMPKRRHGQDARPSSASRGAFSRKGGQAAPVSSSFLDGSRWGTEDPRLYAPFQGPSGGSPPIGAGLTRQASAPSLGIPAEPTSVADMHARGSPQHHSTLDSSYHSRSAPLRRTNSAAAIGGHRGVGGTRPGSTSSAPRRRPYESAALRTYAGGASHAAERVDHAQNGKMFPSSGAGGAGGGTFQHRADALQLESKLTSLLREHSFASTDGGRRPGTADPYSKLASRWHGADDSRSCGGYGGAHGNTIDITTPANSRYSTPGSYYDRRRGASPAVAPLGRSPAAYSHGSRRGGRSRHPESTPPATGDMSFSTLHPSRGMVRDSLPDDSATLAESRLKIYSDLFEEVIERDRVFGTLLRKIKTAYDMLVLRAPAGRPVPPMPGSGGGDHTRPPQPGDPPGWQFDGGAGGHGSSLHSNEPTTRNEAWEIQRENRVLKDLVERLHLELEEAVRREHRWKQKAAKNKVRPSDAGGMPQEQRPGHFDPGHFDFSHAAHHGGREIPSGVFRIHADDDMTAAAHYSHGNSMPGQDHSHSHGHGHMNHYEEEMRQHGNPKGMPPSRSFHQSRREPSLASDADQQAMLNHGGLLSLSSISPENAHSPAAPTDFTGAGVVSPSGSYDGDMLPQRPERIQVIKPDHVPPLDLSRLHERLDEEDEEYDEAEILAAEAAAAAGGHMGDHIGDTDFPYHGCHGEMPVGGCGELDVDVFAGDYDEGDFDEGSDEDRTPTAADFHGGGAGMAGCAGT